ncbi:MAG: UbiA family prenyltransferase [Bryobacteraceae bacterium]
MGMVGALRIEGSQKTVGQTEVAAPYLTQPPLAVDLDGTLVKTDLLIESVLSLLRRQPLYLFVMPFWAARGMARLKNEVAQRVELDLSLLPWRREVVEYLRQQRAEGRSLVLATGSNLGIAQQVADHLEIFDQVFATDETINLCGKSKRDLLLSRFGDKGFDYAADGGGSAGNDVAVWASARRAILVNPDPRVRSEAARVAVIERVFTDQGNGFAFRLKALRPGQWLKNLLVFVPAVAAHRFDANTIEKSLLAFVAFGCAASSGYLLNDLMDLDADRHHPLKRSRPFAAGDLSLSYALGMIPALLALSCVLAAWVSPLFTAVVLAYFAMSAAYTLRIKNVAILDILFLAGLYTVRIAAGSVAIGVWLSHWLLAFSTFLFFSLALVKRYAELVIMRRAFADTSRVRAYEVSDGELLASMGIASGYLAVVVLALYIASDKAQAFYSNLAVLWILCPLMLYWISHVWLTAHRGSMLDDPVVFARSNWTSVILILLMLTTALVAALT